MPDNPVTAMGKPQFLHRGNEVIGLHLHRLRKQTPRATAKDIRQWIINFVGLTKVEQC